MKDKLLKFRSILLSKKNILIVLMPFLLSACSGFPTLNTSSGTKEYFPESKYGAKTSPHSSKSAYQIKNHHGSYSKTGSPYKVNGRWYYPKKNPKNYVQIGKASWYGNAFQGRYTADGEVYDMNSLSAAHPTLPLPCYARVTNLRNGSSIIVRINDRGPYVGNRVIDLSKKAAEMLAYKDNGIAKVKVQYIGMAPLRGDDSKYLLASYIPGYSHGSTMLAYNKEHKKPTPVATHMLAYAPQLPDVGPVLNFKSM